MVKKQKEKWRPYFDYDPIPPIRPIEPQETFESTEEKVLHVFNDTHVSWWDMEGVMEKLVFPPGTTKRDILVFAREYDSVAWIEVGYLEVKTHVNKSYKSEMKHYEREMKRYDEEVSRQVRQLAEYNEHTKREEERDLKLRLRDARRLLKQHGKLK